MEQNRKPTIQEELLLEILVKKSLIPFHENWKDGLLVHPMLDGQMGSLYLFPKGKNYTNRLFNRQISDYSFEDNDGILVIASLIIDQNNELFELDIWKTDFSKLLAINI